MRPVGESTISTWAAPSPSTTGGEIERGINAGHVFSNGLEPRTVKGHYSFQGLGILSKLRYAYQLERDKGTWIVTVPVEFHLPTSRMTDMIDIPFELAQQLGLDAPGRVCAPGATVFVAGNPRQVERGFIDDAARLRADPRRRRLALPDVRRRRRPHRGAGRLRLDHHPPLDGGARAPVQGGPGVR